MSIKALVGRLRRIAGEQGCRKCADWPDPLRLYIAEGDAIPEPRWCPACSRMQRVLMVRC